MARSSSEDGSARHKLCYEAKHCTSSLSVVVRSMLDNEPTFSLACSCNIMQLQENGLFYPLMQY